MRLSASALAQADVEPSVETGNRSVGPGTKPSASDFLIVIGFPP